MSYTSFRRAAAGCAGLVLLLSAAVTAQVGFNTVLTVGSVDGSGFRYPELGSADPNTPVVVSVSVYPPSADALVLRFGIDRVATTATLGADFHSSPARCVIPAGGESCVAQVASIVGDDLVEVDEVIALWVAAVGSSGDIVPHTRTGFAVHIVEDDFTEPPSTALEAVQISLLPGSVEEPQLAPQTFPFTLGIQMENPDCEEPVPPVEGEDPVPAEPCEDPERIQLYIRWWTAPGTAIGGDGSRPVDDYRTARGDFIVSPQQFVVHGLIAVEVFPDDLPEDDEFFLLHVSVAATAHFQSAGHFSFAVGIIDGSPELAFGALSRPGGGDLLYREPDPEDPLLPVEVLVPLSDPPLVEPVLLRYGTRAVSGSAEEGLDYRPRSGVATVALGELGTLITFADIVGDNLRSRLRCSTSGWRSTAALTAVSRRWWRSRTTRFWSMTLRSSR